MAGGGVRVTDEVPTVGMAMIYGGLLYSEISWADGASIDARDCQRNVVGFYCRCAALLTFPAVFWCIPCCASFTDLFGRSTSA